jgi:uncharacterized protein YbjT (DUF2867 family)
MKILVFGASGPLGRRSTEAARTQSLNLRPEAGPAAAMCRCPGLAAPPSLMAEDLVRSHNVGPCRCGAGIAEMIGQRPA